PLIYLLPTKLFITLFPYTTLFRSGMDLAEREVAEGKEQVVAHRALHRLHDQMRTPAERALVVAVFDQLDGRIGPALDVVLRVQRDRKSTRLNSSHVAISYAVFCLK